MNKNSLSGKVTRKRYSALCKDWNDVRDRLNEGEIFDVTYNAKRSPCFPTDARYRFRLRKWEGYENEPARTYLPSKLLRTDFKVVVQTMLEVAKNQHVDDPHSINLRRDRDKGVKSSFVIENWRVEEPA